ncbi:MAG: hypothetical protein UY09_C0011G0017 [Parcubacteria group bacterium GW2011_GWA2_47_8]|nr:MAG: hypothetical protein UY09_C0011G0017 [Parcubacteria group bacterium GW2011_GWA2_47_8]
MPRDAKPGGHYAALFASGQAITDKGTGSISDPASGVDIRTRLGVLLLANVRASDNDTGFTDTIQPSGRIVSFSSSRRVYSDTTIPLSIVVENTGQTHLTANTTVTITNLSGKIVGRMQSSDWHVLPDSVREKRFTWSRSVLFGKYYAVAEVAFAGKIITASTTFWVIPMNIVVAVIIAIALFWFMWWLRQWRAKYPT